MRPFTVLLSSVLLASCFVPVGEWPDDAPGMSAPPGPVFGRMPSDSGLLPEDAGELVLDAGALFPDAAVPCPLDKPDLCDSSCTDLLDDDANCGACATPCAAGERCSGGACVRAERKVFITSKAWPGDLGGLAGADESCQALARAAGLTGPFRALLSTDDVSVESRIPEGFSYVLLDGTLVAGSRSELLGGPLAHAIDLTEQGARTAYQIAASTCPACRGWTSGSASEWGAFSTLSRIDAGVFCTGGINCSVARPVFCVEL